MNTASLIILVAIQVYILYSIWRERKYRRILGVFISGLITNSLNDKKQRADAHMRLVSHIKDAMDTAFGADGFKRLEKDKGMFRELGCDDMLLNQLYTQASETGAAEMRRIEREKSVH